MLFQRQAPQVAGHGWRIVQINPADIVDIDVANDDADLLRNQSPGQQIRCMLKQRQEDFVAFMKLHSPPRRCGQINRLGRAYCSIGRQFGSASKASDAQPIRSSKGCDEE
jgi:hypothetical protein